MRFGIDMVDITPPFRTTMAGYGARQDYYDAVNDPLTFTALLLEADGRRAFIGAADLITFENRQVMTLRDRIAERVGAPVDNVLLNASHTHGGPELRDWASYFREDRDLRPAAPYREWLEQRVLEAAERAAASLEPGTLWFGTGTTRLPMNRRCERDGRIVNAPNLEGVIDDRLQLLALRDADGRLRALGTRVSCHPVATGAQHRITADFPGAFRTACQRALGPGVTAFFLQGAGGDMRPAQVADNGRWLQLPHSELPLLGDRLAAESLAVLTSGGLERLEPLRLEGRLREAAVPCERRHTTREEFEQLLAHGDDTERRYAREALRHFEKHGKACDTVPLRVHTLWLTDDFAVVGIQGEVLVGMGAHVEESLRPSRTVLLGYSNGSLAYIPDSRELARGGYEQSSYLYHGWTGPFAPGIEEVIAAAVWRPTEQ